jgi:hypothetical protein
MADLGTYFIRNSIYVDIKRIYKMTDLDKNKLAYREEKASTGELVTSRAEKVTATSARSTVRIQPNKSQIWQAIQLVQFLGGKPEGRTIQWTFQVLFDSLLAQHVRNGDIQAPSNEVADLEIRKFREASLPKGTTIETLEQIKEIEEATTMPKRYADQQEFGDDLEKAVREQDLEGIGDLFDFTDFSD